MYMYRAENIFVVTVKTLKKIYCPLFPSSGDSAKLSVHFDLQVSKTWTNSAEIWPTNFDFFFQIQDIVFFTSIASDFSKPNF